MSPSTNRFTTNTHASAIPPPDQRAHSAHGTTSHRQGGRDSEVDNGPSRETRARKGGLAATIVCLLALPWLVLFGLVSLVHFAAGAVLSDILMLGLCVVGGLGLKRLMTSSSRALAVTLVPLLLVFNIMMLPQFFTRRVRSPMQVAVGITEGIRASLAAYAADAPGHSFPAAITSWEALTRLVNTNGGYLNPTAAEQGIALRRYTAIDSDGDTIFETYTMSFLVAGIPDSRTGGLLLVSPSGIKKAKT